MTQRRRGIMVRVILFLILGTIVSVAVAWGCALLVPIVAVPAITYTTCNEIEGWAVKRWHRPGLDFVQSMRSTLLAPQPGKHGGIPMHGNPAELLPSFGSLAPDPKYLAGERSIDDRAMAISGWPFRSLWCEYEMILVAEVHGGLATPIIEPDYNDYYPGFHRRWPRALPLRVLWPGFAINTVFYTATLWMLFAFPFALRRFIRRRLGRCVRCGYDLRGQVDAANKQVVCPECGGTDRPKA